MNKEERELFKQQGIVDFGSQADKLVVEYLESAKKSGKELNRQERMVIRVGANRILSGISLIDAVLEPEEK